jgi:hypothetical protein
MLLAGTSPALMTSTRANEPEISRNFTIFLERKKKKNTRKDKILFPVPKKGE